MPKLVNVTIDLGVPGLGSITGTWEPDESEVKAAWELYVEIVTRTPVGRVSSQEGSAGDALTSVYSLFETTRGVLRRHGPSVARPKGKKSLSFGYLAVSMLNLVLRPFLTEWHPKLRDWHRKNPTLNEDEWPRRKEFFEALDWVGDQLRQYATLFANVAEVPELTVGSDE